MTSKRDQEDIEQKLQSIIGSMRISGGEPTDCLLYTSPSPRDQRGSRMPSSA